MRVALLTNEYPPTIYGGAGVHVDFLVRSLATMLDVDVHCFGPDRDGAVAHRPPTELADANAALRTVGTDVLMAAAVDPATDLVHSHTWYTGLAGHLVSLLHDIPHVVTAHSLEPSRPWKAEQLGGGYALSTWAERTAFEAADGVIAVSAGMASDIIRAYPGVRPERIHVIHNGVDTDFYAPDPAPESVRALGVDPDVPYVIYVGRITRQKGLPHLLAACHELRPGVQIVLCASAPDTPEIEAEVRSEVDSLRAARGGGVVWHEKMLPRPDLIKLLSHARAFVCPSVYEPLGIVNLEAAACGTAVVASDVGGIPEVVADGETGLLVHYDSALVPAYEAGLAAAINRLIDDPTEAKSMGAAGRERAVREFRWSIIAEQTRAVYQSLLATR
ncbi:glycogen synthase [Fodinicola acaciae]|uniref:glycogen synthase n=1 Tax=Fodinicola acaciae TaxID=2681555 RepID=UPI0013D3000E|nr:glycogen synthase [Fodinicola acaciae]